MDFLVIIYMVVLLVAWSVVKNIYSEWRYQVEHETEIILKKMRVWKNFEKSVQAQRYWVKK